MWSIHVHNVFRPNVLEFLKTQPEGYTPVTDDDAAIIAAIEALPDVVPEREVLHLVRPMEAIKEQNLDLLYANGFELFDVM
jgi:hypothetical protein